MKKISLIIALFISTVCISQNRVNILSIDSTVSFTKIVVQPIEYTVVNWMDVARYRLYKTSAPTVHNNHTVVSLGRLGNLILFVNN